MDLFVMNRSWIGLRNIKCRRSFSVLTIECDKSRDVSDLAPEFGETIYRFLSIGVGINSRPVLLSGFINVSFVSILADCCHLPTVVT